MTHIVTPVVFSCHYLIFTEPQHRVFYYLFSACTSKYVVGTLGLPPF